MAAEFTMKFFEYAADGLEFLSVIIILAAFVIALGKGVKNFGRWPEGVFELVKAFIGKAMQLSLEFLVAADIIRTLLIEPTKDRILLLGLLVVVRTFLSWSISVEIEGCWPWKAAAMKKAE